MLYLLLSILCSVSVGVFFKLLKGKSTVHLFLIAMNYIVAASSAYFFFQPNLSSSFTEIPWQLVIPLMVLLPSIFLFLPLGIQHSGIIKTDIAQRLSLIIPLLCSFWLFGEVISPVKALALIIGFISVFFIVHQQGTQKKSSYWLIFIFLGYGIIDVLFKQVALSIRVPYTTVLVYIFGGSALITTAWIVANYHKMHSSITWKNVILGGTLGILNFANIYFYLKAHQYFKSTPTTVFATMNFGVVILGTLVGHYIFNEKLTRWNTIGLIFALLSITLIVYAQLN